MSKQTEMTPREAILAVLDAIPDHKIEGKKRLQKLVQLLKFSGAPIQASFVIHHYGPYSVSIAEAADELCLMNEINCKEEPRGSYGMFQAIYTLGKESRRIKQLSDKHKNILLKLNKYTTIELEIAATISLFRMEGLPEREATGKTKDLKPTRAIPRVLGKASEILSACK